MTKTLGPLPASPSRHLRWLRARVPEVRLYAPRVALMIPNGDGGVFVNRLGELPAADLQMGSSISATAQHLLVRHGLSIDSELRPLTVCTGAAWFEDHRELGPLQPIWVVLQAKPLGSHAARGLSGRPIGELALLAAEVRRRRTVCMLDGW